MPALDSDSPRSSDSPRWYHGVSRYQWLVLIIACLGWVFDVFEGQIFVSSMNEAMPSFIARQTAADGSSLSPEEQQGLKHQYNNTALAAFLLGGALGGIVFGSLSDRWGRTRTMSLTILFYSLFTCLSAFSREWWHLAGTRFLVAMGVGGEWAVASALVFEVFPPRARAHVGGIFHASSVLGTYLAIAAGAFIIGNPRLTQQLQTWARSLGVTDPILLESLNWRVGFALGALPALLIIWIRLSLHEPQEWRRAREEAARDPAQQAGRISELFSNEWRRRTLVGFLLASIGMATFWGVHIYGKEVFRAAAEAQLAPPVEGESTSTRQTRLAPFVGEIKRWEMLGMLLVTTGGGLGLLSFGPLSQRIGRRGAFLLFHLGGLLSALVLFQLKLPWTALYVALPIFGFLTLGMHSGYAIYFPELYPTRLRGTGAGFCFNSGRIAAAPMLFAVGYMQREWRVATTEACSLLALLYLVGAATLLFAPETGPRAAADEAATSLSGNTSTSTDSTNA